MINDESFVKFLRILKKDNNLTEDDVREIQKLSSSDDRIVNLFTAFVKYKRKEITQANYQMIYNSLASKYQNMLEDKKAKEIDFSSIDIKKDKELFIKYLTYITDRNAGKITDSNVLEELKKQNIIVKSLEDLKVSEENGMVPKGTYRSNYNKFLSILGELTRNTASLKKNIKLESSKESLDKIDFSTIELKRDKDSFIKYLSIVTDSRIGKEIDNNVLEELKNQNPVIKALENLKNAEENGKVPEGTYRKKYNELLATLGTLTRNASARNPKNIIDSVKDIKKIKEISDTNSNSNSSDGVTDLKSYLENEFNNLKSMISTSNNMFELKDFSLKTKELYDYYKLEIKSKMSGLSTEDKERLDYLIANNDDIKLVSGAKKMYNEGSISFSSYNNLNQYFFEELKEGIIEDLLPDKESFFKV